jgi:hypothetical protein
MASRKGGHFFHRHIDECILLTSNVLSTRRHQLRAASTRSERRVSLEPWYHIFSSVSFGNPTGMAA